MEQTYVLVTGGFDPLHSGHIAYFKAAKKLGTKLIVGLNSDEWLERKKGKAFMSWDERLCIVNNLQMVDEVFTFMDDDDSAINFIKQVKAHYPKDTLIFANGGDRTEKNIPEMSVEGVEFAFGVGGKNKANSSSWILDGWKTQKTERDWGYWRVLDHKPTQGYKVKELVIYPGKALSDQKHFKRAEQWLVLEGVVDMQTEWNGNVSSLQLTPHGMPYEIGKEVWHLASNTGTENAHILEIQWGSECIEEDIERRT